MFKKPYSEIKRRFQYANFDQAKAHYEWNIQFEMKTIFCFFYWTNIEKWPQLISKSIIFKPTCGEKIAQNTKRVHVYF